MPLKSRAQSPLRATNKGEDYHPHQQGDGLFVSPNMPIEMAKVPGVLGRSESAVLACPYRAPSQFSPELFLTLRPSGT
jgi:hypothetical protein